MIVIQRVCESGAVVSRNFDFDVHSWNGRLASPHPDLLYWNSQCRADVLLFDYESLRSIPNGLFERMLGGRTISSAPHILRGRMVSNYDL